MADNSGLREAFLAYRNYVDRNGAERRLPGRMKRYSAEQVFFLSYASVWCAWESASQLRDEIRTDPHSPSYYRIIGPLSNSADFVHHFQCPADSQMNRVDKCILW